jgi:hypothetical protein
MPTSENPGCGLLNRAHLISFIVLLFTENTLLAQHSHNHVYKRLINLFYLMVSHFNYLKI